MNHVARSQATARTSTIHHQRLPPSKPPAETTSMAAAGIGHRTPMAYRVKWLRKRSSDAFGLPTNCVWTNARTLQSAPALKTATVAIPTATILTVSASAHRVRGDNDDSCLTDGVLEAVTCCLTNGA